MLKARRYYLLPIVIGMILLIGGFVYDVIFAGIPYPDPTPELLASYNKHASIASVIRWSGVIIALAGCLFLILRGFVRR